MFALAMAALIGALIIGWAARINLEDQGARYWSWALLVLALSFGTQLVPSWNEPTVRAVTFNVPVLIAHTLWLIGVLEFCGRSGHRRAVLLAGAAMVAATLALTFVWPDRPTRIAVTALSALALRFTTALVLWRHGERGSAEHMVARAAALTLLLECSVIVLHIINGLRGVIPVVGSQSGGAAMSTWIGSLISILISAPLLMLLGTSRVVARLQQAAHEDLLTGLLNRRGFYLAMAPLWAREDRHHRDINVLMLDIDHFKQVNDSFGHATGDQVLAVVGRVLRETLRGGDIAARWGGEEFCVLLGDAESGGAQLIAERIRKRFSEGCAQIAELGSRRVTISVGIAHGTPEAQRFEALQERADEALYEAKQSGRDRVRFAA